MTKSGPKSIFSLEVEKDNGQIRICAYTKSSDDEKTVRQYETKDVSDAEIDRTCSAIVNLLNRANGRGRLDRHALEELKISGRLLYDAILPPQVKKKLAAAETDRLIVIVDDRLVHIPWELLFDGNSFLCRRFNMGRLVKTSQRVSNAAVRKLQKPLKMLLIADPKNDLEDAYMEGVGLRDELDKNLDIIEVNLRSGMVDATSVKGALRNYDILHYAGHADYDRTMPAESGFLMHGGKLTAADITDMTGPAPLPALVFSNACRSGHTDIRKVGEDYEDEIYGLANAFLLAGVQHYIGTFWDVQDEPSHYFAEDFYKELIKGSTVGEAVKKARQGSIERYGEETIIWASYMLYGDPTARYVEGQQSRETDPWMESAGAADAEHEQEEELAGSVRGSNTEIVFPRKRNRWLVVGSVLLIMLAAILILPLVRTPKDNTPAKPESFSMETEKTARQKRTDELVAGLIKDYRENQKRGERVTTSAARTGPPTLVFLNIRANGMSEEDIEYILTGVTGMLRQSKSVQVVEREIIDKLLEELRLSSSQLADPAKVLEIGKILTAQIISTGSISRNGREWQVSLRFIDTETTTIQAALTEIIESADKEKVVSVLGKEILNKIRVEKN
ncbi:MAG: CHAT domain-containing protein [Nitrospirota bacterium]